jgi:hypothetical protein
VGGKKSFASTKTDKPDAMAISLTEKLWQVEQTYMERDMRDS